MFKFAFKFTLTFTSAFLLEVITWLCPGIGLGSKCITDQTEHLKDSC